jgi:cytochrome c-type biogenesis protein
VFTTLLEASLTAVVELVSPPAFALLVAFGVGMASPLLAFALVSEPWRDRVLGLLTNNRRAVNAVTGVVLVAISLYYLLFVFEVAGSLG